MMDAGGRQMDDPPQRHKQRQEQATQPLPMRNQTGFQVPATTFGIQKGGLDPHAPGILLHAPSPSRLIGNQKPGFAMVGVPHCPQVRLNRLLLPAQDPSKPLLSHLVNEDGIGGPGREALTQLAAHRMLFAGPQQVMPLAVAAQLDQRCASETAIGDERTLTGDQMRLDLIEHLTPQLPLCSLPLVL
jgi:hypothetical protein